MLEIIALSYYVPGATTETQALQSAADAAAAAGPGVVLDWRVGPVDGWWDLTATVSLDLPEATVLPGRVRSSGALDPVLDVSGRRSTWAGRLVVEGSGSVVYTQREALSLVRLGDVWATVFDGFDLRHARQDCLVVDGASPGSAIGTDLGTVLAVDCGSPALDGHVSTVTSAWSGVTNLEPASSPSQRARFDAVPPTDLRIGDLVYVEDRVYVVMALEPSAVEVYPHYPGSASSGTMVSAHGAAVRVTGGNTTEHSGRLMCQRAGVCLAQVGAYGGTWGIVAEASGVGLQLGSAPNSGHRRGSYAAHFENPPSRRSVVKVIRTAVPGVQVGSLLRDPRADLSRWVSLSTHPTWSRLQGVSVIHDGMVIDGYDLVYSAP